MNDKVALFKYADDTTAMQVYMFKDEREEDDADGAYTVQTLVLNSEYPEIISERFFESAEEAEANFDEVVKAMENLFNTF